MLNGTAQSTGNKFYSVFTILFFLLNYNHKGIEIPIKSQI